MSSKMLGVGLVGLAIILPVAVARGQERPTAEPARIAAVPVFNPVEGRIVVLSSRPDGTRIEKGEIICELDASELKDRLVSEELAERGLEAEVRAAGLAREVAALSLNEYKDGRFVHDVVTAEAEIRGAESALANAEDSLDWTRRMFDKGYVSMATKTSEELSFKKARFAVEEAQSKRKVLIDHTKNRTMKDLLGAVETARARELRSQAELERQRSAIKRLQGQIHRAKVSAPIAGRIRYASPIGAGAVLRDGRLICRIVPEDEGK
jgi:HlyD family secretion protein